MKRLLPALGLLLALGLPAQAQNVTCATRPLTDSSNACADTAFIKGVLPLYSVTSVGLALPSSVFVISGSPVTTTGTLTGTFVAQSANTGFYGPTTGSAAVPGFRTQVIADLPNSIPYSKLSLTNSILNADINNSAAVDSTKLSNTQTGTGATARSVQNKFTERVSILDFGAVGNGTADDTTAYNNFLAACQASASKTCYLPTGTYNLTSQPSSITVGIKIFGDGLNTIIKRNFNGSGTTGLFDIAPTASGTEIHNLSVNDVAGTSGGNTITAKSDASNAISQLVFEDLYLTTLGTDTHAYTIYIDGSLKTTGAIGARIIEFRNVGVFGAATAGVFLKSVVGANWSGAGSYTAGGTSTTSFVIDGVAAVPSNYVNLAPDISNGAIQLDRAANVIIQVASLGANGSGVSVVNTANTDRTYLIAPAISGTVQSNWTNSGQISPGGSGDITDVGDCTSVNCFNAVNRGTTLTFSNATSGTIALTPVTGALGSVTLRLPAATDTLVGKATTDTLTNKTLTAPTINGGTAGALTSFGIRSTGAAFDLLFASSEAITANRTLSFNVGNAARSLTLSGDLTINGSTAITPGVAGQVGTWSGGALSGSATPTLGASGTLGSVTMGNATSGTLTLRPVTGALGSPTVSVPAATDTLVGKATTDTLTNKTYDTAGTGNVFKINGTTISDTTGTGNAVLDTSPTITTPTITTSATDPLLIGGTAVGADLTLQSTSGVGNGTDLIFFRDGNNGGTLAGTIAATGQVIGNGTADSWGSSFNYLQMGNILGVLAGTSGSTAEFEANIYFDGVNYKYVTTAAASKIGFGGGTFAVATAPSGTAGNTATMTAVLSVSNVGHVSYGGTAPTVGTCGTSPTVTTSSSDTAGQITTGSTATTSCTLTFANTYSAAPFCVASSDTTSLGNITVAPTTSTIVFTYTSSTSQKISWICHGT